jgi:undecaprenyl-diphosphatase
MKFISDSFEVIPFIILSLILVSVLLIRKDFRNFLIASVSLVFGFFLESFFKIIIHRARPENILISETTFSFPSSHATLSLIFFFLLIFLFRKEIKDKYAEILFTIVCVFLIILIGVSRIYLGAHWPTDVFAGWTLGLFCVSSVILVINSLKK